MKHYNLWCLIYEAPDLPGAWIAHCLELDIVTQGGSPGEAREACQEAVEICILADIDSGLDPMERRPAPQEDWAELERLRRVGRPVDLSDPGVAHREGVSRFAAVLSLDFSRTEDHAVQVSPQDAAWVGDAARVA